jgi:RNA polymerase sigma-70 factor (ECF subfamily)
MRTLSLMVQGPLSPRKAEVSLDALAEKARGGDRESLEALLRRTAPDILRLCHRLSGTRDFEDNAQRALEKIVVALSSFDSSRGSFRGWALTVARNVCRDRGRRRGLEQATFDAREPVDSPSSSPGPERLVLARVQTAQVDKALGELPEPMRAALVLFHVSGNSYEEIATTLKVPKGTVMTWLHRGRKRLRASLGEN